MLQATVTDLYDSLCRVDHVQLGLPRLGSRGGRFETKLLGECHLRLASGSRIAFIWAATGHSTNDAVEFSIALADEPVFSVQGICLVDDHSAPLSWSQEREALISYVGKVDWRDAVRDAINSAYIQ